MVLCASGVSCAQDLGLDDAPVPTTAPIPIDNILPNNLPDVTTLVKPPVDFDPTTASDAELVNNGFPPRPDPVDAPDDFATWTRAMKASRKTRP
jgi:hypothetical protein